MKTLILLMASLFFITAHAEQNDEAQPSFNRVPVDVCFQMELDNFERYRGRLPTDDEADLIVDACMKLGDE